jgi:predicted metalloprotease
VLDDAQKTWDRLLPLACIPYRHVKIGPFRAYTTSRKCGTAHSATGPFYCPADEKVYLDLGFFDELGDRLGAPGEFGRAYVIAHEIGHHVQKLLGVEQQVSSFQRSNPQAANLLSVGWNYRLTAWRVSGAIPRNSATSLIDSSDIAAGIEAVAAVGDDRLQKMARGHVSPESFTHGSPRSVPIGSVAALSPEVSSPAHFRRVGKANRANPGLTLLTRYQPA